MKRLLLLVASVLLLVAPALASNDVSLQNDHGDVSYEGHDDAPPRLLAMRAVTVLGNDDVARTGAASMASVTLADSSVVTMASNSVLKFDVATFGEINAAHFVLFIGKMRFRVQHPAGAKADYTFTTPTGQIGVRGTVGDISVDPLDGVRLNMYGGGTAHVTMINGMEYDVPAGQKIWMRWEAGKLNARVTPLTQAEVNRFAELGPPFPGFALPTPTP